MALTEQQKEVAQLEAVYGKGNVALLRSDGEFSYGVAGHVIEVGGVAEFLQSGKAAIDVNEQPSGDLAAEVAKKYKVGELKKLAAEYEVELPEGANKAAIVAILIEAGVFE